MDDTEALSDYSESSRNSECFSSNVSSLSGLSQYECEFFELKKLINPECNLDGSKTSFNATRTITTWYEKQIDNLNTQLRNSVKQNENYQKNLFNVEKKNYTSYNEKIEKVLKQNKQLESNLLAANNQIQRLLNIHSTKDGQIETTVLKGKILQLEQSNHEITNQNHLLSNRINQCTFQKEEIENEYKNLRSEVNDLRLELTAKINCVDELKKKISEQHVQLQNISQKNVKLSHSLDLMCNDLQYVKKSENWYKEELHQLQNEKSILSQKNLENERTLAFQGENIEKLKLELNHWKCACEEMHLTALKEKERILKQIEYVDTHMIKSEGDKSNNHDTSVDIVSITNYYETVISDLTNDIAKIKLDFEHHQGSFENASKENFKTLENYLSSQSYLKEKESTIHNLQNNIKDLKEKLSLAMDNQVYQNSKMLLLNTTCAKLKIEINVKNQEKEIVEKSVKDIKEQFHLFRIKYTNLKDELHKKNKELSQLQFENQELCRTNNIKICEMKNEQEKDDEQIRELNAKIASLELIKSGARDNCKHNSKEFQTLNISKFPEESANKTIENVSEVLPRDNITAVELLNKIYMLCQKEGSIDNIEDYDFGSSIRQRACINLVLNTVLVQIQSLQKERAAKNNTLNDLKMKLNKLKKNTVARIEKLEKKSKILEEKNEDNAKMLSLLGQTSKDHDSKDGIQYFQALLQVKIQEAKDKQKRYERNYRTLLKKVKEHMKGRNTVEKHNSYLQELNTSLSNECNTLKLQLNLRNSEIDELQNCVDNYSSLNEKLKLTIVKLKREETAAHLITVEPDMLKKFEGEFGEFSNSDENSKTSSCSAELIEIMEKENERLLLENSLIRSELDDNHAKNETLLENNKMLSGKLGHLENLLTEEKSVSECLRDQVSNIENNVSKISNEKDHLNKRLENITETNLHLHKEINHLKSCLQQKSEEITNLHLRKELSESRWREQEANMGNLITALRNQVYVFKSDIDGIKNEKFFLQRLCNDLKVALKVHINHNKALKEYLNVVCKVEKADGTLVISNFPSPSKYDDSYIDKLLQENRNPRQDRPFKDVQECLDTLKNEILYLQKQIVEKNMI